MANKDISEVNISHWGKATRSYHLVIRITKIKNTTPNVVGPMDQLELLYVCCWFKYKVI